MDKNSCASHPHFLPELSNNQNAQQRTSDPLTKKEISPPVRRYIDHLIHHLSTITSLSVHPISLINLHQAKISQLPLLHSPPTSISSIHIINPINNINQQILNQNPITKNNQRKETQKQRTNRCTSEKSPATNHSPGSGRRFNSKPIRIPSSISPTSGVQWVRSCV